MSALESLALLSSEPLSRLDAKLLCPKILALSSDDLYGLIEVMHEAEPGCVSYVDDEWDFDLAALKPETLQKAHAFLDKCAAIAAGVVLATGGGGGATDAGAGDRRKRAIGDDGGAGDTKAPAARRRRTAGTAPAMVAPSEKEKALANVQPITDKNGRQKFPCEQCGKLFNQRSELVVHFRTHTGEKPLKCKYCGKGFAHSSNLHAHQRSHLGEKPYKCDHPGCGKAFAHPSSLKEHKYKHAGIRPYKCTHPGCGKAFGSHSNLKRHSKLHQKGK